MALILVLCILALLIFIGVKLFESNLSKISFVVVSIVILLIPTCIMPLNVFTSPFKLVAKLAYTEGNLGYVEFLHDEYGEVKDREVKTNILNKVDFYQTNMESEIISLKKVTQSLLGDNVYIDDYLGRIASTSNGLRVKQTELFLRL
ncbi:MAG: hypothetical protein ACRC6T_00395 [Sarcina sp.]